MPCCSHLLARLAAARLNVMPAALRTFDQPELQPGWEAWQRDATGCHAPRDDPGSQEPALPCCCLALPRLTQNPRISHSHNALQLPLPPRLRAERIRAGAERISRSFPHSPPTPCSSAPECQGGRAGTALSFPAHSTLPASVASRPTFPPSFTLRFLFPFSSSEFPSGIGAGSRTGPSRSERRDGEDEP